MRKRRLRRDDSGDASGKARRRRIRRLYLPLFCFWGGAVVCALHTSVVGWFAALDLGSAIPLQWALVMWGATLGWIVPDAFYEWQRHVAARLYYEDIADGVCPDRGIQMTPENGWKWYRRQGSPWWISSKRLRPWAHPDDALARLEGRNPPLCKRR